MIYPDWFSGFVGWPDPKDPYIQIFNIMFNAWTLILYTRAAKYDLEVLAEVDVSCHLSKIICYGCKLYLKRNEYWSSLYVLRFGQLRYRLMSCLYIICIHFRIISSLNTLGDIFPFHEIEFSQSLCLDHATWVVL